MALKPKDIARFFLDEGEGLFSEEQLEDLIRALEGHIKYGTIKVIEDSSGKICGAIRWNWIDKESVEVLDACVRKDLRKSGFFEWLNRKCLEDNPSCKHVHFQDKGLKRNFVRERESYFKR